jgi:8-oxo-dGTP pyrophosphatase MutT (NUDIX family)
MESGTPVDQGVPHFTGPEFMTRAKARLKLEVPPALEDLTATAVRGDLDLDDELWKKAGVQATKPAAVLVPVIERAEPTALLTLRTPDLKSHSGQIAFPGGKIDADDKSPLDAALREAEEEIGLERSFIDPIGYLDLYLTFSGFRILPVVARVAPGYRLTLNPAEVVETFEVPMEFLMQPVNHQRHSRIWKEGVERHYYAMPFGERYIWGITAGILRNLYERVYEK